MLMALSEDLREQIGELGRLSENERALEHAKASLTRNKERKWRVMGHWMDNYFILCGPGWAIDYSGRKHPFSPKVGVDFHLHSRILFVNLVLV
jgi:hypothetical protein